MNRSKLILAVILLFGFAAYAQESNDDYTIENTWGINKNTRSGLIGGFVFKHSIKNPTGSFTTYGLELMNVRHPAELKTISGSGSSFVLGKINYLFAIRGQYGRDFLLFNKAPQQGVQINLVVAAGPSIGLESPYITLSDPAGSNNVISKGFIFQGLFDSKVIIGANVKTSLSFEFGTLKSSVSGFEAGFLLDAYAREIYMMENADNYAVWPTAFITLFYGSRK